MTHRARLRAVAAIVLLVVLALVVGGYIVAQERLVLPSWVPIFGRSFYTLKGQFQTAQAVTPGQGQAVTVAGVKVGDISSVTLQGGRALVTMSIQPRYSTIYPNATMLLRPKTQLKDMTVELNPGTPASGRALPSGSTLPVAQTAPDVNFDEILASLDTDSQAYLDALVGSGGQALNGTGPQLAAGLKRFDPTARDLAQITTLLAQRRANLSRVVHNFSLLVQALGQRDQQLAGLVQASDLVFATFASQDASIRNSLALLPGTLSRTRAGLGALTSTTAVLGPALHALTPAAQKLAPALRATRPFLASTTPVLANQLRPFSRTALPVFAQLAPATRSVSGAVPPLDDALGVVNEALNELAFNPGAAQNGFLYYTAWANHNLNSVLGLQDAGGPLRHGLFLLSCSSLTVLQAARNANPTVQLLLSLLNPPNTCSGSGL